MIRKRVLLDENLPHTLRRHLDQFDTFTAAYARLAGLKNGKLLDAAEAAEFEVLVTGDQTLTYEQNLTGRRIALVFLSATNWPLIYPHVPKLIEVLHSVPIGSFTRVECGTFSRRSPGSN